MSIIKSRKRKTWAAKPSYSKTEGCSSSLNKLEFLKNYSEVFPTVKRVTIALVPEGQQPCPYKWQIQVGHTRGRKCRIL